MVLGQILLLLLPAAGFGGWLWLLARRPSLWRRQAWLWLGLAGLATHALLLQSLAYAGCPLRWTAWPVLLLGVAGLVPVVRAWRGQTGGKRSRGDAVLYAVILAVGVAGQAPGLLSAGPSRYFGNGHYDQANYVVIAEFLARENFATKADELGYRPWMLRALEAKEQRITECVVLGAVAVVSGADCQQAYGAVNIFFVALAGVATAAWLRTMSLPRWAAAAAGLGAALSPAFTRIHLDGFFSQTASLFVYPALAGLLGGRGEIRRETKIVAALLLAYLVGTYTEVGVFGVTLTVALVLLARESWRERLRNVALILAGALLLNPGYLSRLLIFLADQWGRTRNPATLSELFPEGGTWIGWGRLFVDAHGTGLVILAGVTVAALGAWSLFARPSRHFAMAAIVGVALVPLLLLRVSPGYSIYAFAKLTMQFVPVWLGAAVIGAACLRRRASRHGRAWAVALLMVTAGVWATALPQQQRVIHPAGVLATLSGPELQKLRDEVAATDGGPRFVANADPLLAQWLCYFGRNVPVVFGRRNLGDRIVLTETHAFRRWSGPSEQLNWLDLERKGKVAGYEPPPRVDVRTDGETGVTESGPYYVAKSSIEFSLTRPAGATEARLICLDFLVVPLVPCVMEMTDEAGRLHRTTVQSTGWRRWQLALPAGSSTHRLQLRPLNGSAAPAGVALLKSLSVETQPGVAGVDPEPVE